MPYMDGRGKEPQPAFLFQELHEVSDESSDSDSNSEDSAID